MVKRLLMAVPPTNHKGLTVADQVPAWSGAVLEVGE